MRGLTLRESPDVIASPGAAVVWVPEKIFAACQTEAIDRFPLETGGTFMGWWADSTTAVITAMIGAGQNAHHDRHTFQPDQEWQLAEIARHYEASGRRETYLGDWHSHPEAGTGRLSWTDRRVLRRIISTPAARAPNPLMLILHGTKENWQMTAWRAALRPRPFIWPRLMLREAELLLY